MHYKNGKAANNGDSVVFPHPAYAGVLIVGTLHSISTTSTTCNGQVAVVVPGGVVQNYVTISDGYLASDAMDAVEATTATAKAAAEAAAVAAPPAAS